MRLRIGSRRSPLARAQARQVAERLQAAHPELEIAWVWIVTSGDRFHDRPLQEAGGKGLFLKEIEEALLAGEIDLAIHSGKDVPAELAPGLRIAATPRRAAAHDVWCSLETRSLETPELRVGTGSGRRGAQWRRRHPGARIVPIRGNVETRLEKVRRGEVDGVVLAAAGLARLGVAWEGTITPLSWMLPAPAQGTLALEIRADDEATASLLEVVHDETTWRCFQAERAVQRGVGADCFTAFAVHAEPGAGEHLRVRAGVWAPDGSDGLEAELLVPWEEPEAAVELGQRLAREGAAFL